MGNPVGVSHIKSQHIQKLQVSFGDPRETPTEFHLDCLFPTCPPVETGGYLQETLTEFCHNLTALPEWGNIFYDIFTLNP